ncbi:MAG: DUF3037 domain-containing protein [Solirubrobacterales bacterium]|nr:DUF3037 domain-containing protein [Solirubrobacterales bacterium]
MARDEFQYALWRVVPDLERGEALNVGVVVFCRRRRFLAARVGIAGTRLRAAFPGLDVDALTRHLDGMVHVAAGEHQGGAVAALDQSERFGWLTATSSTIVQPSPVHTGLCEDPDAVLDRLFDRLIAPPG